MGAMVLMIKRLRCFVLIVSGFPIEEVLPKEIERVNENIKFKLPRSRYLGCHGIEGQFFEKREKLATKTELRNI